MSLFFPSSMAVGLMLFGGGVVSFTSLFFAPVARSHGPSFRNERPAANKRKQNRNGPLQTTKTRKIWTKKKPNKIANRSRQQKKSARFEWTISFRFGAAPLEEGRGGGGGLGAGRAKRIRSEKKRFRLKRRRQEFHWTRGGCTTATPRLICINLHKKIIHPLPPHWPAGIDRRCWRNSRIAFYRVLPSFSEKRKKTQTRFNQTRYNSVKICGTELFSYRPQDLDSLRLLTHRTHRTHLTLIPPLHTLHRVYRPYTHRPYTPEPPYTPKATHHTHTQCTRKKKRYTPRRTS